LTNLQQNRLRAKAISTKTSVTYNKVFYLQR